MKSGYVPRATSVAHQVIAYLKLQPAGCTIHSGAVREMFDCKNPSSAMRKAVDAGLVTAEQDGNAHVYGLPAGVDGAEEDAGQLQIATYSDGDVAVKGGQEQADGSVLYTRAQLLQLFAQLTTPHIVFTASITNRPQE